MFFSGLSVTYRPDGQELAVATLNGEISFWNPHTATQTGSVAGRHDLQMGRKETDKITAKQSAKGKWVRRITSSVRSSFPVVQTIAEKV